MEKKKVSILKIILNTLVVIIFIALVAIGGGIGYLYFKYQVNVFACIDQISKLNSSVNESTLVTNGYTEDDYNRIKAKIDSTASTPANHVEFTDNELGAYLSKNLDKVANFNFGDTELNLTESGFRVLQIKFSDIPVKQPDEHYCDLNVILKLNIASVRDAKMNGFPVSLLKNFIPDVLYVSADCSIDEVEGNYVVTPTSIAINNLSVSATKSFLETINKFVKFTTAEELNQNISSALTDALLGDSGVYGVLKDNGATGYGWQSENKFVAYFVENTELNKSYSIAYANTKDAPNSNINTYTIRSNKIVLEDLSANGYDFLGWYTDIDDESSKVETIDAWDLQDYTLTAKWQIVTYTITCDLRGGKIGGQTEYSRTYTVEDVAFNLPDTATKYVNSTTTLPFAGWIGDGVTVLTKVVTIEHGSYGDKHFAAYYEGEDVDLTLVVDGVTISTSSVEAGTVLSLNNINSLIEDKLAGYTIDAWYTNDARTNEYDYSAQLVDNKTLYATSTYLTNDVYFYPYIDKFDYAISHPLSVLNIDSREMLIGYIDYCIFYDITEDNSVPLNLTYYSGHSAQEIVNEIGSAGNERNARNAFSKAYEASIGYEYGHAKYYLTDSDSSEIASNHFDGSDFASNVYAQQDYVLRVDDLNIRDDSYDDFVINYIGNSLTVSTSEQLVWALENGYRPICKTSSSAENVYNKAKTVLRNICSDNMSDIEKLQAIYKWLALHVNYDQEALYKYEHKIITNEQARTYDSWYAEGVFNYGKAVCEGYSKSLLIMAKLEGIPTICVSGDGHMWNRVFIAGKWYGIDATHGDLGLKINGSTKEVFTNTSFLFTDTYKTSKNYTATNYVSFIANTAINAYSLLEFTDNGNTYDLFIDNQAEFNAFSNYISSFSTDSDCDFYTIEVAVADDMKTVFETRYSYLSYSGWSVVWTSKNSYDSSVYMLKHNR